MVVGKILEGQDNKNFMHNVYPHCCHECNYPTKQEINDDFQIKCRNYDVSYTYDGYLIVSKKFKLYCENKNYNNIMFYRLPKETEFYCVAVNKALELDYKKREVKFINKCHICGRYAEVIGATPAFIKDKNLLTNNDFYKSSVDFGSFEGKSPLIILNNEMAQELLKQKFKGLYFDDIFL